MYDDRLVIPKIYRNRVLKQIHRGHPGIERTKAIARSFVYWPGIDNDIRKMVNACSNCASAAKMPIKAPFNPWPVPNQAWERIHVDYAGPIEGFYYLIIVDALSKWPEIIETKSISAPQTVKIISEVFARFGLPATLVSDNGTQFKSDIFEKFLQANGVEHICTSPYYPMSNGQAERFVDTFKRALKKMKGEGTVIENTQTFLQTYRSTGNPNVPGYKSPAEIMFGRRIRTTLDQLKPPQAEKKHISESAVKMKKQFDRKHGTIPKEFRRSDTVFIRMPQGSNHFKWVQGAVIDKRGAVMYNVRLMNGKIVRAHTNQLRRRNFIDDGDSKGQSKLWASALEEYNFQSKDISSSICPQQTIENKNESTTTDSVSTEIPLLDIPRALRRSQRERQPVNRYAPV